MLEGNIGQGPGFMGIHGPVYDKDPNTGGALPESDPNLEAALANRLIGRGENLNDELLATAENGAELFFALREIQTKLEDGNIPHSLTESYRPPGQLSIMFNRAQQLKKTPKFLISKGWLRKYDPVSGEGMPTKRKFSAYALRTDEEFILDENGDFKPTVYGEPAVRIRFVYGTEKERTELARSYDRAILEMEARAIIGEYVGLRLNLDYRDNLEGLVDAMHSGRMPKFRADHLTALFNMPDVDRLAENSEDTTLGDQVEMAMFLNLVMLNSTTKQRMKSFLSRPGADILIDKIRGSMSKENWIKEYIGNVSKWSDNPPDAEYYKKEPRGLLTKYGNISNYQGSPGEFTQNDETEFIKNIGSMVGSEEASWTAASFLKAIGAFASEGYTALPNGKSELNLGEARFYSSDDTGKFWAYMWNMKEGTRNRPSGLRKMIGKIPDMAMNLFDWWQVNVELPGGNTEKRSVWDAWLGTPAGIVKKNLLTMQDSNQTTNFEPYHRLGNIKFDTAERYVHESFTIMQWLLGREGAGVLTDAMKVDFRKEEFSLNELKKKIKYINICFNPSLLTKGSPHLYTDVKDSAKIIQKNYFRNLMFARIHSATFITSMLGDTVPLFDPDVSEHGIPVPVWAKANIDEALRFVPEDEEMLLDHYLDKYSQWAEIADSKLVGEIGMKTTGTTLDRINVLDDEFLPSDESEREKTKFVGKVTAKNFI